MSPASSADAPFARLLAKKNMCGYYKLYSIQWRDEGFLKQWQTLENYIIYEATSGVGFMSLQSDDRCLYIRDIQIIGESLGKGIGTWSIAKVIKMAQSRKKQSIRLRVFKHNPAKALYERLGFIVVGSENNLIKMELKTLF